jgi:7,8-dihydropterin-6-yl-methyl-4-(beta-D-ribofuranosyl)aminobenzene 5'-phosphate synthase
MRRTLLLLAPLVLVVGAFQARAQAPGPSVTVTYLYDNTTAVPGTTADWGFACLVETNGRRVLFDTGTKPEVLRANLAALKIDIAKLDALVLSHDHGDHTGGVSVLGPRPGLPTFFPASFSEATRAMFARQQLKPVPVTTPADVVPGVTTSGQFGTAIPEEALIVDTDQGLVVIFGCAHPGAVEMLRGISRVRNRPFHLVLGGFHLLQSPADRVAQIVADFKAMQVAYVSPTHCTGEAAIKAFRQAYGTHFIEGGVGRVVKAPIAELGKR